MSELGLSSEILNRIDLGSLQEMVKRTVEFILSKEQVDLQKEDRLIVESAMDLWAHLVKGSGGGATVQIDNEFLLRGLLLSKELKLRDSFEATFREIANISTI